MTELPKTMSRGLWEFQVRLILRILTGDVPPCFAGGIDNPLTVANASRLLEARIVDGVKMADCPRCGSWTVVDILGDAEIASVACGSCGQSMPGSRFL